MIARRETSEYRGYIIPIKKDSAIYADIRKLQGDSALIVEDWAQNTCGFLLTHFYENKDYLSGHLDKSGFAISISMSDLNLDEAKKYDKEYIASARAAKFENSVDAETLINEGFEVGMRYQKIAEQMGMEHPHDYDSLEK